MAVSEKIKDITFSKSVAGYSAKEVDGFLNDIYLLMKEQEQAMLAYKAKLDAFEGRRDELRAKEQEAYHLLEAAKKKAEEINAEAKISAEAQTRAASARAAEIITDAEEKARGIADTASENAKKTMAAADAEARAMLEKVKKYTEEEKRKAQGLSDECAAFEASFKSLVADTAAAFARVKENTPMPANAPKRFEPVIAEPKKEEAQPIVQKVEEPPVEEVTKDVEIVGGMPIVKQTKKSESTPRRLFDTVSVTYDDDDDFSDIREIIERGGERKSPVHFSE